MLLIFVMYFSDIAQCCRVSTRRKNSLKNLSGRETTGITNRTFSKYSRFPFKVVKAKNTDGRHNYNLHRWQPQLPIDIHFLIQKKTFISLNF